MNTSYLKLFLLLFGMSIHLHADMAIASLNSLGQPMAYGVCDTAAAVSDSGMTAFIAPVEDRSDSAANGFHASYLLDSGNVISLYPGYAQELAQFLQVYSKTTNVRIAANRDFTAFAIIVEKIKSGTTPTGSDVTTPTSLGTWLAIVDAFGNKYLDDVELVSTEGSVSAKQCHVSFADDGRLLAACGQYLGLRLYDSPTTDLASFTTLDVGYKTGTAVITGDGSKVFFTRDGASQRAVCYMDTTTNDVVDTGLTADGGINDAQVAASHDGSVVAFRKTAGSLSIAVLEDGAWKETVVEGTQIRSPAVSSDGRYVVYQTRGTSYSQIMEYDRQEGTTTLLSQNGGAEADADCTSPSISADGSRVAFVSAASNLAGNGNGQKQLYVVKREVPSVTLELKRGWNFCGVSITPDEDGVALLKKEPACWVWANGRFRMMEELHAGQGFWLYVLEDKTLQLTGEEADPTSLQRGWNLVVPSMYPEAALKTCFGMEGRSYVRLADPANYNGAAWVFY
ncbi:MAG: hypothetical protein K6G44_10165 [Lentisphaeria bacterium]|nr:hypothetical protein [Lentisphaeria bacterium]